MSEEDENEYVANSPCGRWSRGEKEGQGKAFGIGGLITKCYHALDLDEGMEVVWNEIEISQAMHNLIRQGGNKGAMDNILKTFKRIEVNLKSLIAISLFSLEDWIPSFNFQTLLTLCSAR